MPLVIILIFIFFMPGLNHADELPNQQIAFYKSKTSPFASGEATFDELTRAKVFSAEELVKYETEFYQYGQQKISTQLIKPTFAKDLNITSGTKDTGYFLTLVGTHLRSKPQTTSSQIFSIPAGSYLIPLKFKDGFIEIIYHSKKGYVDITHCISKFDYAYAIYAKHPKTQKTNWYYVKSRYFDQIEIFDGTMIPLSATQGLSTHNDIGIITKKEAALPLWSKVKLINKTQLNTQLPEKWNQSVLKKHGLVWWKSSVSTQNESTKSGTVTIDDLLKKEIYSTSSLTDNPKNSIASTNEGVFITSDGSTWTRIEQFDNFKGPVFYYNSNMIFVGTFRSVDHGKTFHPFVNITTISQQLKNNLGYNPHAVKVQKISSSSLNKITFDVLADSRKIKLQSLIYNQDWKIIR